MKVVESYIKLSVINGIVILVDDSHFNQWILESCKLISLKVGPLSLVENVLE